MIGIKNLRESEVPVNSTLYWMKKKTLNKMRCFRKMMREERIPNKLNRIGKLPIQTAQVVTTSLNKIKTIKIVKWESLWLFRWITTHCLKSRPVKTVKMIIFFSRELIASFHWKNLSRLKKISKKKTNSKQSTLIYQTMNIKIKIKPQLIQVSK